MHFAFAAQPGTLDPDGRPVVGWHVGTDDQQDELFVSPILLPEGFTVGPMKAVMPMKVTVEDKNAITGVDLAGLEILRTDKAYKSKSFWQFKDPSGLEFLFVVDPEVEIPNDERVTKITRDAFFDRRKNLPVVDTDLLFSATEEEGVEPETETEEADDDDGFDMI